MEDDQEEEEGGEECCICLAQGGDFMALPGCGHRVHVMCGLKLAQAMVATPFRCPLCRHEPLPATNVPDPAIPQDDQMQTIRQEIGDIYRRHRARVERRRRLINSRPHLLEQWRLLRTMRRDINGHVRLAQRTYEQRCREVYRDDPQIREMRHTLGNMRRRERRLERKIEAEIRDALGIEPEYVLSMP